MAKKSKKVIYEDLLDATCNFIIQNAPAGFNKALFHLYLSCGRAEEATDLLNNFGKDKP